MMVDVEDIFSTEVVDGAAVVRTAFISTHQIGENFR